jgi:hypothetical protein
LDAARPPPEPESPRTDAPPDKKKRHWALAAVLVGVVGAAWLMGLAIVFSCFFGSLLGAGFGVVFAKEAIEDLREAPHRTAEAAALRLECEFGPPKPDAMTKAFSVVSRLASFGRLDVTKIRANLDGSELEPSMSHVFVVAGAEQRCSTGGSSCPCLTKRAAARGHVTHTVCESHDLVRYDPQDLSNCSLGHSDATESWKLLIIGLGITVLCLSGTARMVMFFVPGRRAKRRKPKPAAS